MKTAVRVLLGAAFACAATVPALPQGTVDPAEVKRIIAEHPD